MDYDRLTTATQSLERLKVTAQGKQAMYIDNAALARPWRDIASRNISSIISLGYHIEYLSPPMASTWYTS